MKKMKTSNNPAEEAKAKAKAKALLLPPEITFDIFSRLGVPELCRCRLVCKAWYEIIEDPKLGNDLHHLRQLQPQRQSENNLIVFHSPYTRSLSFVDVNSEFKLDSDFRLGLHASKPLALPSRCFPSLRPIVVGSSNGLLCLHDFHHNSVHVASSEFRSDVAANTPFRFYYILNPITNHIVHLPYAPPLDSPSQCPGHQPHDKWWCGANYITTLSSFAFDATTKTYKIIEAWTAWCFRNGEPDHKAVFYMLTIGSSKWTRILEMDDAFFVGDQGPPAFVNNALHWLMVGVGIGAIRLGEAPTFAALKLPRTSGHAVYTCLTSLNGRLSLIQETYANNVVCWSMDEYGMDSSWSSKFEFRLKDMVPLDVFSAGRSRQRMSSNNGFRILTTMDNGNTILVTDGEYIICCNLEKNQHRVVEVDGLPPARERRYEVPLAHVGSLISPETIAGSAQINVRPWWWKHVVRKGV